MDTQVIEGFEVPEDLEQSLKGFHTPEESRKKQKGRCKESFKLFLEVEDPDAEDGVFVWND